VHVEHLLIDEEKMSKSLGNVFNLPDIVAKGYRPSTLRYLLIATHYRKQVKFSWDAMNQAEESLRRLADFVGRLERVTTGAAHPEIAAKVQAAEAQFKEAMEQDLNTAGALGAMFELVRMLNAAIDSHDLGAGDVPVVKAAFDRFDLVLGLLALRRAEDSQTALPAEEIDRLVTARQDARKRRDFAEGDRIRQQLLDAGIVLEDSPTGTRWKRK
jgi:cysteinyl-tRNA synthetase